MSSIRLLFFLFLISSTFIRPVDPTGESEAETLVVTTVAVDRQPDEDDNCNCANGSCDVVLELVLVQDVSQSFESDLANLVKLMPAIIRYFKTRFQDKVRMGIVSFIDKPIDNFGHKTDYCARVIRRLTPLDSNAAITDFQNAFSNLEAGGGRDYLEGFNEAVFRTAFSNEPGWSEGSTDPVTKLPIVRSLLISTDAPPHDAGVYSRTLPAHNFVRPPARTGLQRDINYRCDATDYPEASSLTAALLARDIHPIVFAGVNHFINSKRKPQIWAQYDELVRRRAMVSETWSDLNNGLVNFYKWYMESQLDLPAIVERLDRTSSNFLQALDKALKQIDVLKCKLRQTKDYPLEEVPGLVKEPDATGTPASSENEKDQEPDLKPAADTLLVTTVTIEKGPTAEADTLLVTIVTVDKVSAEALLAEADTLLVTIVTVDKVSPEALLAEADTLLVTIVTVDKVSAEALLAEADTLLVTTLVVNSENSKSVENESVDPSASAIENEDAAESRGKTTEKYEARPDQIDTGSSISDSPTRSPEPQAGNSDPHVPVETAAVDDGLSTLQLVGAISGGLAGLALAAALACGCCCVGAAKSRQYRGSLLDDTYNGDVEVDREQYQIISSDLFS